MNEVKNDNSQVRVNIIQTVQTPLGFFTLVVLVVEILLGIALNLSQGTERVYLIASMVGLILLLIAIVAGFAFFRPEALVGKRPLNNGISSLGSSQPLSGKSTPTQPDSSITSDPRLNQLVPELLGCYRTVSIPDHQPLQHYGNPTAPIGLVVVGKVPFYLSPRIEDNTILGHRLIAINPTEDNVERIVEIPARTRNIVAVHFLLSAGYGWAVWDEVQFLGKRIGYIELVFVDKTIQKYDLILGKNIREWAFGNSPELVTNIDTHYTHPAWVSYDNRCRIDALSISVPRKTSHEFHELSKIRVVAKFEEDPGKKVILPAIMISAITCEEAK